MNEAREILLFGRDILTSPGMKAERRLMQHGRVSVYEHSVAVAAMCLTLADALRADVDRRALVRGALLHDYFLYDWHEPGHAGHGFSHAFRAVMLASRDFVIGKTERDMIAHHMFPLNPRLPMTREGAILTVSDKLCALSETLCGRGRR